jgi:dimeric dUTPase (all-alpha-NTP-PPase superfamily)
MTNIDINNPNYINLMAKAKWANIYHTFANILAIITTITLTYMYINGGIPQVDSDKQLILVFLGPVFVLLNSFNYLLIQRFKVVDVTTISLYMVYTILISGGIIGLIFGIFARIDAGKYMDDMRALSKTRTGI